MSERYNNKIPRLKTDVIIINISGGKRVSKCNYLSTFLHPTYLEARLKK